VSIRKELNKLLRSAGLNIREWACNDQDILRGLSEIDKNQRLQLGESPTLKTLGVFWDSHDDAILYSIETKTNISHITKRSISSVIARIYDPLKLLEPVIVRAKILLQRVWALKVDWDESLPSDLHSEWKRYYSQLTLLIKLPEIHLPTFDGTIENWHSFYDSFSSTIDRSERLTPVQKFHYLRSSLTGKAARSIQSLDITELNYSIAIDVLKEKFDCHLQVCMRHWDLIFDYPKITEETSEAVDDFHETVKVNLQALEKLGEPVTSNAVLIKLFTLKLPSATIRKWQRTLLNKKMPSFTHIIDIQKTRTNGGRTSSTTIMKKNGLPTHIIVSDKPRREPTHLPLHIERWCVNLPRTTRNLELSCQGEVGKNSP
jgi:hypothetical protein